MMRINDAVALNVEDRAVAMLKGLAVQMAFLEPRHLTKTFAEMTAPAMVAGHAWRAIKLAAGPTTVVERWQRTASLADVTALLSRAAMLATKSRHAHPGRLEFFESGIRDTPATVTVGPSLWLHLDKTIREALRRDEILAREGAVVPMVIDGRWQLAHAKSGRIVHGKVANIGKKPKKSRRVKAKH